jgi:fumarate reductase flavoprotein subunit
LNLTNAADLNSLQSDVLVIGGGGAGLAAALTAAEMQASVIVLEKRHMLGGNSAMAQAFFAAESPTQQRMGIDAPADVLFRMAMDYAHWRINPRLMRAFINKSGDTVRWLEEMGLKIDRIPNYPPNILIRTFHFPEGGGAAVTNLLAAGCRKLGVNILTRAPAKNLLIDSEGKVCGATANVNGQEIKIKARSTIIASGGYGGNKDMLKKYCPDYSDKVRSMGIANIGDGILMAIGAGAANEGLGMLQLQGPVYEKARNARNICMESCVVWVNNRGERFTSEDTAQNHFECVNSLVQQPDMLSYTLFDETIKDHIIERIMKGYITFRGLAFHANRTAQYDLTRELQREAATGKVRIAGSWAEIAGWMGISDGRLNNSIAEYNAFCDQGYDPLFNKGRKYLMPLRQPPFYAIRCYPIFLTTIGGIKINHNMEVLKEDFAVIPGLFAAGNDAGGWEPRDTYNAILSGHALGFAFNSGRIAGENAVLFNRTVS